MIVASTSTTVQRPPARPEQLATTRRATFTASARRAEPVCSVNSWTVATIAHARRTRPATPRPLTEVPFALAAAVSRVRIAPLTSTSAPLVGHHANMAAPVSTRPVHSDANVQRVSAAPGAKSISTSARAIHA